MSRKSRRKIRAAKRKPAPAAAKPFRCAAGAVATIKAADGDGQKLPTFKGVAYTGAPMTPGGWWQPVVIDLAGVRVLRQERPVLRQHDHTRIVGHTTAVKVTSAGIEMEGVMSGKDGPDAQEVITLAGNGFPWQLSVGADPVRTEFLEAGEETEVNGRTVTGPLTISRETELGEISFVPLGADGDTSVTVSASRGRLVMFAKEALKLARKQGVKAAQKYSDEEIDKMTEAEAKAAMKKCMAEEEKDAEAADGTDVDAADGTDTDTETEKKAEAKAGKKAGIRASRGGRADIRAEIERELKAARSAAAAESRRINEITARVQKYGPVKIDVNGQKVDLVPHAIEAGWSPDTAELHALRNARPTVAAGPTVYVTNQPEMNDAVLEAAILHGLRHQFQLADDAFYTQPTPDGKGAMRRVPQHVQAEAQRDFKVRYTDQVQQAAHTHFKGRLGLQEFFQVGLRAAGASRSFDLKSQQGIKSAMAEWDAADKLAIRAEGASTISISNILANVLNKFALQGYLFTEQTWRDICGVRPVNDFKATKSINLLGQTMFKQVGPTGELENFNLGDQSFSNQAAPYGGIITIPWTHIVNDDLGILGTVPQKVGQGAGLALNDAVWSLWSSLAAGSAKGSTPSGANLNGDDGVAFFRTSSSQTAANKQAGKAYNANKTSGGSSALSAASLQTVKALFDNQTDPNGNPLGFDGMKPTLLFGPSNWQTAMNLLYASGIVYGGASAALQPNNNAFAGYFTPAMSRYLENANYLNSTTAWFILFNPAVLPAIECCFLNGVDTPAVLTAGPDYQFDRLGISIRGTMPFGVNQQNFRGAVYSVGA